jgi:hypothetical protein
MNNGQDFQDFLKFVTNQDWRRLTPMVAVVLIALVVGSLAWGWWFFFVGLVGYALLYYFSFRAMYRRAGGGLNPGSTPASPFNRTTYDLSPLQGKYRQFMERAVNRRATIERTITGTADPGVRRALEGSTRDLSELVDTIYSLALKAQSVESALQSSSPMAELLADTKRLDEQIKSTNDEFQRGQYQATLDGKLQQMQNITDTQVALQRWDAQMDNAISTLDTIMTQIMRMKSSEVLSYGSATDDVSRTLRQEVDELKATSDALDSVYGWSKPTV